MDVYSRMHSGKLYSETDENLTAEQLKRLDTVFEYNNIRPSDVAPRTAKLKSMFAEIGEDCYIETPFYSNWGGKHVHFGNRVYANYNLTLVDDTHIYVGDNVMFGPSVIVATAGHSLCVELREKFAQFNLPVNQIISNPNPPKRCLCAVFRTELPCCTLQYSGSRPAQNPIANTRA